MNECKDCKWWELIYPEIAPKEGVCKRYPPMLIHHPFGVGERLKTLQPLTEESDSCGEFQK